MPKTSPVRVAIATHGCKLNQAESETMGRQFAEAGYSLVAADQPADIYILNTCTVTHVADGKARRWLRAAYRRNPEATVVATGCYAERDAEGLAWVEGVGLVVGNRNKGRLLELVQGLGVREKYGSLPAANGGGPSLGSAYPSRTRAFVKIQDGCNQFCTFCIAPFTRDREANVPINDVIDQVRARVREGYKEIVITGPQIGSYGLYPPNSETRRDPDDYDGRLHGLVERILGETGVPRLRISSIQPQDLTARLLDAWQDQRLCRHVHMALQSGSDAVLGRMRRRYSTAQYRRAIERLRGVVTGLAMTTDVMVGFPG
ncbi:MAG: MiaB/RimO family radical SAM methylthiotransferase, partial [Dehalococcoidia bacterium]